MIYEGQRLGSDLRLDLLVEGMVLVECRRRLPTTTTAYNKVFEAQALTYLRLLDLKLALVINLGEHLVKDGVHRVVNGQ